MICQYHNDWEAFVFRLIWRSQAKPTSYRAILCSDGAALGAGSAMAAIVAQELSGGGYTRQPVSLPDDGAASSGRWVGETEVSWTLAQSANWRYLVIIANGLAAVGDTSGVPVLICDNQQTEAIVANSPREFQIRLGAGN